MLKRISPLILLILASWAFQACDSPKPKNEEVDVEVLDETSALAQKFPIRFLNYVPSDLSANATPNELCTYAWEAFFALNWKASYPTNGVRDQPDPTWGYNSTSNPNPSLLVWETYAHRAEYRPASGKMADFNAPPHYDFKGQKSFTALDGAKFDLFNNLDENNEIASCYIYGQTATHGLDNLVLFQAKCNSEQYNYVKDSFTNPKAVKNAQSATKENIKKLKSYYPNAQNTCDCPPGIFCLPCGKDSTQVGAIEIKTAWRQLTKEDDSTRFIRRTVIDYVQDTTPGQVYYRNKEYALIGIHIIHKTKANNNFFFATFEQVDVVQASMGYETIFFTPDSVGDLVSDFPRYSRLPLPTGAADSASTAAHNALKARQPASLLQYYTLTGIQGVPQVTKTASDSVIADSNSFSFYLANYVIESDPALANFHGTFGEPHSQKVNELYDGNFISGGGCQGCHGSAQLGGSDFSFISASRSFDVDVKVKKAQPGHSEKLKKLIAKFDQR